METGKRVLLAVYWAGGKAAAKFYGDVVSFRAALWRIFTAATEGKEVPDRDLALLDEWKVRPSGHCRIVAADGAYTRHCRDEAPAMERAIHLIVEAAEDLLLNGRLNRLHTCGNDHKVNKFCRRKKNNAAA